MDLMRMLDQATCRLRAWRPKVPSHALASSRQGLALLRVLPCFTGRAVEGSAASRPSKQNA